MRPDAEYILSHHGFSSPQDPTSPSSTVVTRAAEAAALAAAAATLSAERWIPEARCELDLAVAPPEAATGSAGAGASGPAPSGADRVALRPTYTGFGGRCVAEAVAPTTREALDGLVRATFRSGHAGKCTEDAVVVVASGPLSVASGPGRGPCGADLGLGRRLAGEGCAAPSRGGSAVGALAAVLRGSAVESGACPA